jgi:uncharacterized protein DUF4350
MSHQRELALGALLAVAVTVAVLAGRRSPSRQSAFERRTSAFLAGPRGSKASYDVLARLGRPVQRRRRPLFGLAREGRRAPGLLVVLHPPIDLQAAELAEVVGYVRSGGAVLAAGDGGGIVPCTGWVPERAGAGPTDSLPVRPPRPRLRLPPVVSVLKPAERDSTRSADDPCAMLVPSRTDTLLAVQDGRPVALRLHYPEGTEDGGGGQVTLVADPGYFRNVVWRHTDVPAFVVPLFLAGRRGAIVWDEFHQQFGRGGSLTGATLAWLAGTPAGWAILQLAAVLLAALAVAAVRFGPARPVIDVRRRSALEHLEALAAGLEGAAGVDTAVALTVDGLRRRLGRTGQLRVGDEQAWLATLEAVLPTSRAREAARRIQRTMQQPGGAERVLAAAQAVEDVWEELHPRKTRAAS